MREQPRIKGMQNELGMPFFNTILGYPPPTTTNFLRNQISQDARTRNKTKKGQSTIRLERPNNTRNKRTSLFVANFLPRRKLAVLMFLDIADYTSTFRVLLHLLHCLFKASAAVVPFFTACLRHHICVGADNNDAMES